MSSEDAPDAGWRPVALRVGLLLGGLVAVFALALALRPLLPSVGAVQARTDEIGLWAFVLAVPILAGIRLAMLPSSVATATAGLVLGTFEGALAAVVAATIAACAQLVIGRYVLGTDVRARFRARAPKAVEFLERRGWLAVLIVRLVPLPHGPFSYAAGGTSLAVRHMALGTVLGAAPPALAYATIGGNLDSPFSIEVLLAVGCLLVLAVAGALLARRNRAGSAEDA